MSSHTLFHLSLKQTLKLVILWTTDMAFKPLTRVTIPSLPCSDEQASTVLGPRSMEINDPPSLPFAHILFIDPWLPPKPTS